MSQNNPSEGDVRYLQIIGGNILCSIFVQLTMPGLWTVVLTSVQIGVMLFVLFTLDIYTIQEHHEKWSGFRSALFVLAVVLLPTIMLCHFVAWLTGWQKPPFSFGWFIPPSIGIAFLCVSAQDWFCDHDPAWPPSQRRKVLTPHK